MNHEDHGKWDVWTGPAEEATRLLRLTDKLLSDGPAEMYETAEPGVYRINYVDCSCCGTESPLTWGDVTDLERRR